MNFRSLIQLNLALVLCFPFLAMAQQEPATDTKPAKDLKAESKSEPEAKAEAESTAETNKASKTVLSAETELMIEKIIEVGKTDNQVQQHLDYLTNRIGPRLTGSEGLQAACEWARDEFATMGLESRLEQWGEFDVGFERGPAYGLMVSPKEMKLEFGTNAWTAGTHGRVLGKVMLAPKTMEELEESRDSIKGAYVLMESMPRRRRGFRREPPVKPEAAESENKSAEAKPADAKTTDVKPADAKPAEDKPAEDKKGTETPQPDDQKAAEENEEKQLELTREERQAILDEVMKCEPAGIIRGTFDDLILTGGSYQVTMDDLPTVPNITMLKQQWDELKQLVVDGEDVQLAFDIRNHFRRGPVALNNVIADIPGTEWPDQYVIVGGHIDSWDGATGATDNGAGCATTMEAARILMAAGAKPKRTIRFMLWSGEEQGLLGSQAYVEKHQKEVNETVSAVFVHDGGTNFVSGIRCTEAMRPDFEAIFAAAMKLDERAPFEIESVPTVQPRGGSDHVSFIRAGVPGFFWNQQGRATYRNTHHTQYDTYETVVPEYQKHSSIVIAIGALGTANLEHLLPRDGVESN